MWLLAPCPWILASRRKTIAWAECSELLLSMHDLELCPVPLHWHPAHTGTHPLQDKQAQRLPYCLFLILSAHTSTLETNSWDDIWAFQVWAFQVLHRLTWAVASKCFSLLIYLQSSFVARWPGPWSPTWALCRRQWPLERDKSPCIQQARGRAASDPTNPTTSWGDPTYHLTMPRGWPATVCGTMRSLGYRACVPPSALREAPGQSVPQTSC